MTAIQQLAQIKSYWIALSDKDRAEIAKEVRRRALLAEAMRLDAKQGTGETISMEEIVAEVQAVRQEQHERRKGGA